MRDRMAGRYWQFYWLPPGRHNSESRWRRKVEKNRLRRFLASAAHLPADRDEERCVHGCAGPREGSTRQCSEHCRFTCHPPDNEMFGDSP